VPLLPVLAALLIVAILGSVQRRRGTSSRGRGGRPSGPRINSRLGVAPNPRLAGKRRLAAVQSGPFAAAHSITAAQPFVAAPLVAAQPLATAQLLATVQALATAQPLAVTQTIPAAQPFADGPRFSSEPGDPFAARPALHLGSPSESRAIPAASWTVGPVASVSVLASFIEEADNARPNFAPSNSGDAFPTKARALSLIGGELLAALGVLILSLASTPIGHHASHLAHTSIAPLALLCVFVGLAFAVVAAARVQHDIMGGGWYPGFPVRYISPEVARYAISPSGISAAARRLNTAPGRVILLEYALVAAAVLVVLDRYVAR
jgi:hypothetical protein